MNVRSKWLLCAAIGFLVVVPTGLLFRLRSQGIPINIGTNGLPSIMGIQLGPGKFRDSAYRAIAFTRFKVKADCEVTDWKADSSAVFNLENNLIDMRRAGITKFQIQGQPPLAPNN